MANWKMAIQNLRLTFFVKLPTSARWLLALKFLSMVTVNSAMTLSAVRR